MLAKEIKIKNIKKQREFIESQLRKVSELNTDGDISYTYIGYIFPEVQKHFVKEGFKINQYMSDFIAAFTKGHPINLFTIKDDVVLSDAELEEAENVETTNEKFERILKESGIENPFETVFEDPLKAMIENVLKTPLPEKDSDDEYYSGQALMGDILSLFDKYEQGNLDKKTVDDGYEDEP